MSRQTLWLNLSQVQVFVRSRVHSACCLSRHVLCVWCCCCHSDPVGSADDDVVVHAITVVFVVGAAACGLLLSPCLAAWAKRNADPYTTSTPKRAGLLCYGVMLLLTFGVEAPLLTYVLKANPFAW